MTGLLSARGASSLVLTNAAGSSLGTALQASCPELGATGSGGGSSGSGGAGSRGGSGARGSSGGRSSTGGRSLPVMRNGEGDSREGNRNTARCREGRLRLRLRLFSLWPLRVGEGLGSAPRCCASLS